MAENNVILILKQKYPSELVFSLVEAYSAATREYRKQNWKYSGNELGQFIEVARRMLEFMATEKYTPLSEKLPFFSESSLRFYEQVDSNLGSSYRLLIPRYLYAMASIRNKRGIIHKSEIDPNSMDLTILLQSAKWILAEFVRLCSELPFEETARLINALMEREETLFWHVGSTTRILNTKMNASSKILCLLYCQDLQTDVQLQNAIEYKNTTAFKSILKALHAERKIEYSEGTCFLSPLGVREAEAIIARQWNV